MRVVGERKLKKLVISAIVRKCGVYHTFNRWGYDCVLTIEDYEGELNLSLTLKYSDIEETFYRDVKVQKGYIEDVHNALADMYRLCEVGILVKIGMFSNEISRAIEDKYILEFFEVNMDDFEESKKKLKKYKYSRKLLKVTGMYFGEVEVVFLYSVKIDKIVKIVEINKKIR